MKTDLTHAEQVHLIRSNAAKKVWTKPGYRELMIKKMSATMTRRWAGPDREVFLARAASETTRARMSASKTANWTNPEYKTKTSAAQSQGATAAWADPERKAARLQKLHTTRAAKKAQSLKESQ